MAKSPANPTGQLEFEDMSDAQLQELMSRARQAMHDRFASRVEELRAYGRELGFEVTIARIGETGPRRGRRKSAERGDSDDRRRSVAPKFRNSDNYAQTWSGRGREPQWYKEQIASGTTEESLLINAKEQGSSQRTETE